MLTNSLRTVVVFQNFTGLTRVFPFCLCRQTFELPSLPTNLPLAWQLVVSLACYVARSWAHSPLPSDSTVPTSSTSFFSFLHLSHSSILSDWFFHPLYGYQLHWLLHVWFLPLISFQPQNTFRDSVRAPKLLPSPLDQCLRSYECFLKLETAMLHTSAHFLFYPTSLTYSLRQQRMLWGY